MQIIQSFWNNNPVRGSIMQARAGWLSPMFHYMGWALSCMQLRKFYGDVFLYTNGEGHEFFTEALGLPYRTRNIALTLDNFPKSLWAMAKINIYNAQQQPFLHIDGDVFIWEPLNVSSNAALVIQNFEHGFDYNSHAIGRARELNVALPDYILQILDHRGVPDSINAGVIGGHDLDFMRLYTTEAFSFFRQNEEIFTTKPLTNHFNCLLEQILFFALAVQEKKELQTVLPEKVLSNDYSGFANFESVPHATTYVHPVGSYKRNRIVCRQLAERLEMDYPDLYYRIIQLYREDYNYWFKMQRIQQKQPNDWINCKL